MTEPLPAECGFVLPANGSPVRRNSSRERRVVKPMSKQVPVLLKCPSRIQRT